MCVCVLINLAPVTIYVITWWLFCCCENQRNTREMLILTLSGNVMNRGRDFYFSELGILHHTLTPYSDPHFSLHRTLRCNSRWRNIFFSQHPFRVKRVVVANSKICYEMILLYKTLLKLLKKGCSSIAWVPSTTQHKSSNTRWQWNPTS